MLHWHVFGCFILHSTVLYLSFQFYNELNLRSFIIFHSMALQYETLHCIVQYSYLLFLCYNNFLNSLILPYKLLNYTAIIAYCNIISLYINDKFKILVLPKMYRGNMTEECHVWKTNNIGWLLLYWLLKFHFK